MVPLFPRCWRSQTRTVCGGEPPQQPVGHEALGQWTGFGRGGVCIGFERAETAVNPSPRTSETASKVASQERLRDDPFAAAVVFGDPCSLHHAQRSSGPG